MTGNRRLAQLARGAKECSCETALDDDHGFLAFLLAAALDGIVVSLVIELSRLIHLRGS